MIALLALAAIVRRAGGSRWLSVLAVALLALDNLFLVHSRIATPDVLIPYNVDLMNAVIPSVEQIAAKMRELVEF